MKKRWMGLAAAALVLGLPLGAQQSTTDPRDLRNPPEFKLEGNIASGTLEAKLAQVEIAGERVRTTVYNGLYAPPIIRVPPGGTILLDLKNSLQDIGQYTNIHFHGMNVSPRIDSDDIFEITQPGQTRKYRVELPPQHPPGMFWYHSHAHRYAQWQVFGGLSGGIIVEGLLDPFPQLKGITERIMLLKNIRTWPGGRLPNDIVTSDPSIHTINGQENPIIRIAPGETQLWRIGNVGANQYYRLRLDGHEFWEVARDGNRVAKLVRRSEVAIAPSSRVELLVQGAASGQYILHMETVRTGPQGDNYKSVKKRFSRENFTTASLPLATVVSSGATQSPVDLSALSMPAVKDLRQERIDKRRVISFSESADGNTFFVNGDFFDPKRTNTTVQFGTNEEWLIRNVSGELHVFHIHQLDFQVVEINGKRVDFVSHQDTVTVPVKGSVKIIIPFTDPWIVGRFVYHCHIMEHEDKGMMAVIEVVDPEGKAAKLQLQRYGRLYGANQVCKAPLASNLTEWRKGS